MTTNDAVQTWERFGELWAGPRNFMIGGECLPFDFKLPPIDRVVAEMLENPNTSVGRGDVGDRLLQDDCRARFCDMPLDQALQTPFTMAHFHLSEFDEAGKFLHGFERAVLQPWKDALTSAGFTFERCYPIIFISGRDCATNYHMDLSHVMAWQVYGSKRFCGLKDPGRWAPHDTRINYTPQTFSKPADLTPDDELCYMMSPGDALWNVLLTPHWVHASGDEVALSINFSHGGLRFNGQLSQHEQELEDFRNQHPSQNRPKVQGEY